MKAIHPYLAFDGNCAEAINFYQSCLGGELQTMSYADTPCPGSKEGLEGRLAHARLESGQAILLAGDCMPGQSLPAKGSGFCVMIECENTAEIERLFASVAQDGKITMPLQDMFWGARFGMLTDRFGINWMFNCNLQPAQAQSKTA